MDRAYPCLFCQRGIQAYAPYTSVVATLLRQFKGEGQRSLSKVFAPLFIPMLASIENPLLIPVPASNKGFSDRGFDQMLLIARLLKRTGGYPYLRLFAQEGKGQSKFLSMRERQVRHTLTLLPLNEKAIQAKKSGHTFVLLDDIYTTGATLSLSKTLLAEAYGIEALSLVIAMV
ncbi:MAG TPA: ComF family protein [Spirochaetales bacterium]|nr:ComF family protein [Spirochaetales bacterium]